MSNGLGASQGQKGIDLDMRVFIIIKLGLGFNPMGHRIDEIISVGM
jgi:hypothetical protein